MNSPLTISGFEHARRLKQRELEIMEHEIMTLNRRCNQLRIEIMVLENRIAEGKAK